MGFITAVWDFMWVAIAAIVGYYFATLTEFWYVRAVYVFCMIILGAVVVYKASHGAYK